MVILGGTLARAKRPEPQVDQHCAHAELEDRREHARQLDAEDDGRSRDEEQHRRMSEAPACRVEDAAPRRRGFHHDRGDRGHVIRLEGVAGALDHSGQSCVEDGRHRGRDRSTTS